MTALERLIDEGRAALMQREWYAHAAFEKKAKAEIKAMAERDRRSIGQRFRFAAARIAAQLGANT